MKKIFLILAIASFIFTNCNNKYERINYKEASGYKVHKDLISGEIKEKLASSHMFNKYFYTDLSTGERPSHIDYNKHYVTAIILDKTDLETDIIIDSLIWHSYNLHVYYSIITGPRKTCFYRPSEIIVVEKKYNGGLKTFLNNIRMVENINTPVASFDRWGIYGSIVPLGRLYGYIY